MWAKPASGKVLTLRQLVRAADHVGVLETIAATSEWVEVFGARRIVTRWRVAPLEPLVGTFHSRQALMTLGGSVGDVQQWVPHAPQLRLGNRYLVATLEGPLSGSWVAGMMQGAFLLSPSGPTHWRVRAMSEQAPLLEAPQSAVCQLLGKELREVRDVVQAMLEV